MSRDPEHGNADPSPDATPSDASNHAHADGDAAPRYPRGNRFDFRHPRPTVVVIIVVLIGLGGAFAWRAVQPEPDLFCTLAGRIGSPVAATPDGAFDAWFTQGGAVEAQAAMAAAIGHDVDVPRPVDFEPIVDAPRPPDVDLMEDEDGGDGNHARRRAWMWRERNSGVRVDVGPSAGGDGPDYVVSGVNTCG